MIKYSILLQLQSHTRFGWQDYWKCKSPCCHGADLHAIAPVYQLDLGHLPPSSYFIGSARAQHLISENIPLGRGKYENGNPFFTLLAKYSHYMEHVGQIFQLHARYMHAHMYSKETNSAWLPLQYHVLTSMK